MAYWKVKNTGRKMSKMNKDQVVKEVLDAYFEGQDDSGRWTSQDICDNLRDTVEMTPDDVFRYMKERGYVLRRTDDRMVWCKRQP